MHTVYSYLRLTITCYLITLAGLSLAQTQAKVPSLESIWLKGEFFPKPQEEFRWMKNDGYYSRLSATEEGVLLRYSIEKEGAVDTLVPAGAWVDAAGKPLPVDDYVFSTDEQQLLLITQRQPIYRHSRTQVCYLYNIKSHAVTPVFDLKPISNPSLSPTGKHLGFTYQNNVYLLDLANQQVKQVTTNGAARSIINGSTDWVYEEEFGFPEGFYFSPDGAKLAYYRFDESEVPLYGFDIYGELYPQRYEYKYPKAGQPNAKVSIHLYDIAQGSTVPVQLGTGYEYIPSIQWASSTQLAVLRLNRLQNNVDVLLADASTGATRLLLNEHNDTYLELDENTLRFLKDGKRFIWLSERDGYMQAYLYDMQGKLIRQLTRGKGDITQLIGLDEERKLLYYQSSEGDATQRHIYAAHLEGKYIHPLTQVPGVHAASLSSAGNYILFTHSRPEQPPSTNLATAAGKQLRLLQDNQAVKDKLANYMLSPKRFIQVPLATGNLNAWMIRPQGFDSTRKYPLLMFCYGGPGVQTVLQRYEPVDFFFYQLLANQGYIIASVDNRGTGARGAAFKKSTYGQLGKLECEDQLAAARYLATLPYVDASRMGLWGWSFGGYLTSLCLVKGPEVFKAGIAVAPVTNWRYYDSIYTERFLKTPQENPGGYDDNSPLNFADKLQAKYLLVHGTADDNVHFQNSADWVTALIKANKQFSSFYYPNKNHGIRGGNTRYHLYQMMLDFWAKNL